MSSPAPMNRPSGTAGIWSGLVSLLFWLALLTSAALYAAVALAPKVIAWQTWEQRHRTNQAELVDLETRCNQLEQVIAALHSDPQFAAEVVRLEFDALVPGEEVIPVSRPLALQPAAGETAAVPPIHASGRWRTWLEPLAGDQRLRRSLLGIAAALVVAAFTFLHDGGTAHRTDRTSLWQRLRSRYAKG
jgi:cell division protein FtsB